MNSTDNKIYSRLIGNGIPAQLANIIIAQARHETGDYTSNAYKIDNNLFGYKYIGQTGATKGIKSSERDYYAHYRNIEASVDELCRWINRRQKEGKFPNNLASITSPAQYAQLLKNNSYYGSTLLSYTTGLIAALKRIGAVIKKNGSVAAIFIFAIIILALYLK